MIEVVINKALAGDSHAFARIVQIAEKHEVFNWQPEVTIDTSGYAVLMRKLEEMGYDVHAGEAAFRNRDADAKA